MGSLIISALVLIGASTSPAADKAAIVKGSDEFEFVYRVKLPEIRGEARLWIPLAKTDSFQTIMEEKIDIPITWEKVRDRDYGNDICVIQPRRGDSGKTIELRYLVVRKEKSAYPANGEDTSRFLHPEKLVPMNATFQSLAQEAAAGKKNDLDRAKALYDHVLGRMRYDKTGTGWGKGDAVYACDARTGNCSDFHAYFIALARSVGIPARFAIGATIPADKNEGAIEGYHCWAEFFANGRWVPVDISEAWKNPPLAEYYFGHNPANRFELTKGRDLIVDPPPATVRSIFSRIRCSKWTGKPLSPRQALRSGGFVPEIVILATVMLMQGFGLQGAVVVDGWMGLGTSVVELITEDFAMRAWSRFLYA